MHTKNRLILAISLMLTLILGGVVFGLQVTMEKGSKGKKSKGPPDEEKFILRQIEEAYKAPREVDADVLKHLRKSYEEPSTDREAKMLKHIRRLYPTTPEQEELILREIRRAYQRPSAEQEERIFREIRRFGQLPLGTVPTHLQAEHGDKLFNQLDQNDDGKLVGDEMTESLRIARARWDANRDAAIDLDEFRVYYQTRHKMVSDDVAAGKLQVPGVRKGPEMALPEDEDPDKRPTVFRIGKLPKDLPSWFVELDQDQDAQVSLYEWRRGGKVVTEYPLWDLNDDGLVTVEEVRRSLARQAQNGQPIEINGKKNGKKQ